MISCNLSHLSPVSFSVLSLHNLQWFSLVTHIYHTELWHCIFDRIIDYINLYSSWVICHTIILLISKLSNKLPVINGIPRTIVYESGLRSFSFHCKKSHSLIWPFHFDVFTNRFPSVHCELWSYKTHGNPQYEGMKMKEDHRKKEMKH